MSIQYMAIRELSNTSPSGGAWMTNCITNLPPVNKYYTVTSTNAVNDYDGLVSKVSGLEHELIARTWLLLIAILVICFCLIKKP